MLTPFLLPKYLLLFILTCSCIFISPSNTQTMPHWLEQSQILYKNIKKEFWCKWIITITLTQQASNLPHHLWGSSSSHCSGRWTLPPWCHPLTYKPFVKTLWISYMYSLTHRHSVHWHQYKMQALFESGSKTDWSHANCQTQMQVLIINATLGPAALNHGQMYPPPTSRVLSTAIWSQFVIKENSRKNSASACDRLFLLCFAFFFSPFPRCSGWLLI